MSRGRSAHFFCDAVQEQIPIPERIGRGVRLLADVHHLVAGGRAVRRPAGTPSPDGLPVFAKFDQNVIIWSEIATSASSQGALTSDFSAPKTYSISPACRAPMSFDVAATPLTFWSAGTGRSRSQR